MSPSYVYHHCAAATGYDCVILGQEKRHVTIYMLSPFTILDNNCSLHEEFVFIWPPCVCVCMSILAMGVDKSRIYTYIGVCVHICVSSEHFWLSLLHSCMPLLFLPTGHFPSCSCSLEWLLFPFLQTKISIILNALHKY